MDFSWLSDIGSGISDAASAVGSGVSDVASTIGTGVSDAASWVGKQFSGSGAPGTPSDTGTNSPSLAQLTDTANGGMSPAASGGPSIAAAAGLPATDPAATAQFLNQFQSTPAGASAALGMNAPQGTGGGSLLPTNAPPPAVAPPPAENWLQSLGVENKPGTAGAGDFNWGNIAKGVIGAGGLGYQALTGQTTTPATKAVTQQAAQTAAQGQQLESYLANGTLPPGAQQYVDAQTSAQQASIKSKYAQMGMSGSTAEAQELANVASQAQAQMFNMAQQLYSTGVAQTGASSNLYKMLMDQQNQDNTQMGNAINTFVSGLAGGGSGGKSGVTLNLPGATTGTS